MKKTLRVVAFFVLGMGGAAAQALPIVTVGTQEWLQPKDFVSLSWNAIAGVCSSTTGVCSNATLGTTNMDGWRWASNSEMNDFFNAVAGTALTGDFAVSAATFGTYMPLFTALGFLFTAEVPVAQTGIEGWTRTTFIDELCCTTPYYGTATISSCPGCGAGTGDAVFTSGDFLPDDRFTSRGGWFVRAASPAEVPGPATLPLVGLSLVVLGYIRRLRKKKA